MMQRVQVGMARAMGGDVVHRELRSSHSPFLSMPGENIKIILEAIAAFTGRTVARSTPQEIRPVARREETTASAVRLLRPGSWIRYGIPLGLGRIIGSGIVVLSWLRSKFSSA